ncbi:MAG: cytochrome c-type biogenesis protein CcmH [Gammaproteobacteria bacterium]|nr:cytochrome c-type biogenesis protein CcmH [Gammaproteobacteria bacterium]
MIRILFAALLFASSPAGVAQVGDLEFADAKRQALYAELLAELRCLVCANQSLADSNAGLAKDLRVKVHEMVADGAERGEVIAYMTARYGDYVRYRPRLSMQTLLLWFGPFAVALAGLAAAVVVMRASRRRPVALSAAQARKAKSLLEGGDGRS